MQKKIIVALVFVLATVWCISFAADDEKKSEQEIIDELAELYGAELSEAVSNATDDGELERLAPGFDAENIISGLARGESIFSIREICGKGADLLIGEIRQTIKILVLVLALSILSAYLVNLNAEFGGGAAQAAFFACYAIIVGIAAAAFLGVVRSGRAAVESISVFMRIIVPVVLTGLASCGAVISAGAFEAILIGVTEVVEWTLEIVFIPLIMMAAAMNILNNLSEKLNTDKLAALMNKAVKWGMGIMLTVFVGITGLQGIASGSADGLTVKVTKFAASNLIPVVGGILSESVETVMNCSIVIKNSVGVAGIMAVILIAVIPLTRAAANLILFRLCAAIIQPIADKRIVKCLSEMADSVSCIFSIIAAVAIMFVIILTIIISVGNSVFT